MWTDLSGTHKEEIKRVSAAAPGWNVISYKSVGAVSSTAVARARAVLCGGRPERMEGRVERLEDTGAKIMALMQTAVALQERVRAELGEARGFVKDSQSQSSSQSGPGEAAQLCTLHPASPLPQQLQATSPSKLPSAMHLGNSREQYMQILDAILKNQEALRMVLMNQDTLKGLVEGLQKSMSTTEERIQSMEQEMSILAQFTQELNQVGEEANWS